MTKFLIASIVIAFLFSGAKPEKEAGDEGEKNVRIPTDCEVCRVFAHELGEKMKQTSSKMKLELGSKPTVQEAKKIDYSRSELRLIEILDSLCSNVSSYFVHNHEGMNRYAKKESETLSALNGLRKRGVKVEIGMPWDIVENQPNKEISALKRKCEALAEEHEDDISAWFFQHQEEQPEDYFCRRRFLDDENKGCLKDDWRPYGLPYSDEKGGKDDKEAKKQATIEKDEL